MYRTNPYNGRRYEYPPPGVQIGRLVYSSDYGPFPIEGSEEVRVPILGVRHDDEVFKQRAAALERLSEALSTIAHKRNMLTTVFGREFVALLTDEQVLAVWERLPEFFDRLAEAEGNVFAQADIDRA